ncbi:hypothetical protein AB0K40_19895 [Nonomuraea bangladeshensis]|uniref:Uncharacterized protein n=1 Tax=Nonomuraea bangladeshensis TaxID=404385 RepID=A0ABV3H5G7_9ACTN
MAWVHYRQLDADSYLAMRLLPRCAESLRLRPITTAVNLEVPVGSPEQQAVETGCATAPRSTTCPAPSPASPARPAC